MFAKHPVAYSSRYYEKVLLSANRFLGVPNPVWSLWATAMVGMTGWFASGDPLGTFIVEYGVWLPVLALMIWLVLRCLTPGRANLKRMAFEEHRREVQRVAQYHDIASDDVLVADSEIERQLLERGSIDVRRKERYPIG